MEELQLSIKIWADKEAVDIYMYVYTRTMEYCTQQKKNEILPFAATWMDLEGILLSEIS